MTHKTYVIPPERVEATDFTEINHWLDLDISFVYGYSPEALRSVAEKSTGNGYRIIEALVALTAESSDELFDRPGWSVELADKDWSARMVSIARSTIGCEPFPYHQDEPCFIAKKRERDERLLKREAQRLTAVAKTVALPGTRTTAAQVVNVTSPIIHPAASTKVEQAAKSPEKPTQSRTKSSTIKSTSAKSDARNYGKPKVSGKVQLEPERYSAILKPESSLNTNKNLIAGGSVSKAHSDQTAIYLPPMKAGKFSLPHILTGCKATRGGGGNKFRKKWTTECPLEIRNISGYSAGSMVIYYEGEELSVGDIELWSKALQFASNRPLGRTISFTQSEMRRALNRPSGGTTYATLRAEVARLERAHFTIRTACPDIVNTLAAYFPDDAALEEAKKTGFVQISFNLFGTTVTSANTWSIEIPPMVRVLFGEDSFSLYDEAMYFQIRKNTARRLFMLYDRHNLRFPLTSAELQEFTGSTMTGADDLKKLLDSAHTELVRVGFIANFEYKKSARRNGMQAYVLTANTQGSAHA